MTPEGNNQIKEILRKKYISLLSLHFLWFERITGRMMMMMMRRRRRRMKRRRRS